MPLSSLDLCERADAVLHRLGDVSVSLKTGQRASGTLRRPYPRPDREFWQFRPYVPGDAMRDIDWRRSATGDTVLVKQHQRHDHARLSIWVDQNPGMDFSGLFGAPTKQTQAQVLALVLAQIALKSESDVMWIPRLPARRTALARAETLLNLPALPLSELAQVPVPAGSVMLISDFWEDPAMLDEVLRHLPASRYAVDVVQVMDRAEIDLPYQGRVRFEGRAGESELIDQVDDIRDMYQTRRRDHQTRLQDICLANQARYIPFVTDTDPVSIITALLEAR